ncbi:MAG: metallopeptidase TldD-related protein [Chloroflexota bacterium]|nr:metallopeptidase TldD-related protein [Chloroflexota bacterium]
MLEKIVAGLEQHQGVSDWTVSHRRSRSVQLYLIGRETESLRDVATEEFDVEVFNDHSAPGGETAGTGGGESDRIAGESDRLTGTVRGVASLKLVPADAGRVVQRLDDAVLMAQLVHNPPYTLAEPATYPEVPLADPELVSADGAARAAQAFAGQLWELVEREAGVRLSAAELFLTYSEVELRNSRGIRVRSAGTRVLSELVLLASGNGAEDAEHFRQIQGRRLADLHLPTAVAEAAQAARDTLRARAPKTGTAPVVLSGDALIPLFEAFTYQASAAAAYMKLARFDVGESIYGERDVTGERLTLRANALRPFGLASHRFGADGLPGQDTLLIQDGVLRARHATQRYAQYLGIPATGALGNTEVAPGGTSLEDLTTATDGGPTYHVVGFSAPDVDPITGDFGSEIRLGYEVTPQGRRPIKGGSVSGNVFDAFASARFARDTIDRGEYAGPAGVRFAALRVSGED